MTRIFQKPKLEHKEYLKQLENDILTRTKELETLDTVYSSKSEQLLSDFMSLRAEKDKELYQLENTLQFMRRERIELLKPIDNRKEELDTREKELDECQNMLDDREQSLFERERSVESSLDSVKDLSNQLGETKIKQMVKEKFLSDKEKLLKAKENDYLLKVESFRIRMVEENNELEVEKQKIASKEFAINGREENIIDREKLLLAGNIKLADQRGVLERAWKELESKKHVGTKRS